MELAAAVKIKTKCAWRHKCAQNAIFTCSNIRGGKKH